MKAGRYTVCKSWELLHGGVQPSLCVESIESNHHKRSICFRDTALKARIVFSSAWDGDKNSEISGLKRCNSMDGCFANFRRIRRLYPWKTCLLFLRAYPSDPFLPPSLPPPYSPSFSGQRQNLCRKLEAEAELELSSGKLSAKWPISHFHQ